MLVVDHTLTVPLDHDDPAGPSIEVFARGIAAHDGGDRPYLVYLQGGPGFEAPRPSRWPSSPAWLGRALRDYRVLMLDQRGTGRSTPYGAPGEDPAADAERLRHYRADSIVRDAECFREHLGVERWSVLGQSFGGFCSLHYLSAAPESLRAAYVTGGLPPVGRTADDVYSTTFNTMRRLNERYLRRFPEDRDRLTRLLDRCDAGEVRTPDGVPVSRRLMRTVGAPLGMDGGAESIHHLLELDPDSQAFRYDLAAMLPFKARNPLYAVVHEACYADGGVTAWAAERMLPAVFDDDHDLFTGEHVYPWMFEDYGELAPLREAAELVAAQEWPPLYDPAVLAANEVPCAAAIYTEDMYVEREFSEETAAQVAGIRTWVTSEFDHNGLRADGARVLGHLIDLVRGRA